MLVQCEECKLHYDDSWQSKKCGSNVTFDHDAIRSTPMEDHVTYTRAARANANAQRGSDWPDTAPVTPADASADQLPTD